MGSLLIFTGLALIFVGLMATGNLGPLGRLPGDISVQREGFSFYAPFTTMLLLSVAISLALWYFRR